MATYAIGDIQGCFEPLQRLLRRIRYARSDRLWLVGDLVNRGPQSLEVLRWARRQGDRVISVLGNHDLHLLSRAAEASGPKRRDTLSEVLAAPDRGRLLAWLASRPLLHRQGNTLLVHAGLSPDWTVQEAVRRARRCERALRSPEQRSLLAAVNGAPQTSPELAGLASDIALFTRLRTLTRDKIPCETFNGALEETPRGCIPWFRFPHRASASATVIFGHWAALGLHLETNVLALDSACVWGGALTALRLDDRAVFQVRADPSG